jgi:hypothetical protein
MTVVDFQSSGNACDAWLCFRERIGALTIPVLLAVCTDNPLAGSILNLKGIELCTVCANKLLDKGSLQNPIKSAEIYLLFERLKLQGECALRHL